LGFLPKDKALEVDHILPLNKGGRDDLYNFQVLCYSHNATKRDRGDTDFRGMAESYNEREKGCFFCDLQSGKEREVVGKNKLFYAIRDGMPVTSLHTFIIPKRHICRIL
jgi:galactose-1-phosphate uridylyltransferase